jgi:glycosyltransferase involved in cell wall biosynthesis
VKKRPVLGPQAGIRVLLVVNADWFFLSHRLPIARALLNEGFDVSVVAAPERNCQSQFRAEGIRFIPIPLVRRSKSPYKELRLLYALVQLYRSEKPLVVHHVTTKPVLYGSIAASIAGVPFVVNALPGFGYVGISQHRKARFLKALLHVLYKRILSGSRRRVILQNPDDIAALVDLGIVKRKHTALVRGSGVDTEHFNYTPEPRGVPMVLFASRVLWSKGVGEFVDAVRTLRENGIQLRACIAGAPDMENPDAVPIERLISWSAEGTIEWLGNQDEMPRLIAECNIFVLPSYREGLPKVLLEAAACGRAIVSTDTPGCREVVRDGYNGLLVPIRDAAALSAAIGLLLKDPEKRAVFGARGRALVADCFTVETVVRQTLNVYQSLLGTQWPHHPTGKRVTT